jgi:pimeloyl-ACP methyl ester carboxylesterase
MATPGSSERIRIGARTLEYRWIGPAPDAAPSLVFLHEALGCVSMWRGVPEALAARTGCGALVYSRAGHGRSGGGTLPWPVDCHAREAEGDLPALLDALAVRDAVLIGHSDGATIALVYAGRAPDPRLRGVVSIAAHVFNETVTVAGIERTMAGDAAARLRQRLRRHHGDGADRLLRGWSELWRSPAFRDWSVTDDLRGITVPVLAIQGADDEYGTEAQVRAIVAGVRGRAQAMIVPDCGHAPHLEAADRVGEAVARFVASLPSMRPPR